MIEYTPEQIQKIVDKWSNVLNGTLSGSKQCILIESQEKWHTAEEVEQSREKL